MNPLPAYLGGRGGGTLRRTEDKIFFPLRGAYKGDSATKIFALRGYSGDGIYKKFPRPGSYKGDGVYNFPAARRPK